MNQSYVSKVFSGRRRSSLKLKKRLIQENNLSRVESDSINEQDLCDRHSCSTSFMKDHSEFFQQDSETFPKPSAEIPKSSLIKFSKSFSESGHTIDELCTLSPCSMSKDPKSSLSPVMSAGKMDENRPYRLRPTTSHDPQQKSSLRSKAPRWVRRCLSSTFHHHQRPFHTANPYHRPLFENECPISPMPGSGIGPPKIPEDLSSGAAARAAAATQNEIVESIRILRLTEPKIPRDSESGIGIEMRDQEDNGCTSVLRTDPSQILPEELIVQILSYLNADSLINAELVFRRWNRSASSHYAWKSVFHNEFQLLPNPRQNVQFQVGGHGLGKLVPNQEWKRMWKVRKALHQRWQDGLAAAVYLDGHTDSVYCVQFDEYDYGALMTRLLNLGRHKILTGSRDRTIRIWDAHTYECIKVLGVPRKNSSITKPRLPSDAVSRGQRPFLKVFSPQPVNEPITDPSTIYHRGSILSLQYNDEIMITGSSDCTCIVWDINADYHPIRQLRHHTAGVLDVCFDDNYIISCSKDTTVCVWDRHTGEFLRKLSGHRGPVNAVQLRGNLVVSASGDGVAKLWNLTSGLCIKEFLSKDRGMACVEFSPDSRTILAGGNDQVIYQFDTNTGELVRELNGHRGLVRSLHLDSANGRIVSGSYDTSVKAYDLNTGDNIVDFAGWTSSWILSAKADYRRIIATSQDTRTVIMDFGYELPGMDLLEG